MGTPFKRLHSELNTLNNSMKPIIKKVSTDESNFFTWKAHIVMETPPYNKGAFIIEITIPPEYPFKPPKVVFLTPIYHPNIDEKGQICLPIINSENWKPANTIAHIMEALINILHTPEVEHAVRTDLAREYTNDRKKYLRNAEEHTRQYSEPIP